MPCHPESRAAIGFLANTFQVNRTVLAYDKIKRLLEKHGAGFGDVVKIVSYVTDMRYQADYGKCRSEVFGATPPPAHTLLNIVQLAWPGMMVEVDVTAMVPLK
jgi:2-iminobutanoate/2-iminopropanoate deaminase